MTGQPDPCGASCETAEDATREAAVTASNEKHWLSPNGVDHLIWRGKCVTCGRHHTEVERV